MRHSVYTKIKHIVFLLSDFDSINFINTRYTRLWFEHLSSLISQTENCIGPGW